MRMLRALLVERFGLTFHTETREASILALVPAKGGLKLQKVDPGTPSSGPTATMPHFAARLSNMRVRRLGRPVVDMTGFDGEFKYAFEFKEDTMDSAELQVRLTTALSEQLALKLEPRKAKVDVMVVDHIERIPTPN